MYPLVDIRKWMIKDSPVYYQKRINTVKENTGKTRGSIRSGKGKGGLCSKIQNLLLCFSEQDISNVYLIITQDISN